MPTNDNAESPSNDEKTFSVDVGRKEQRKIRARRDAPRSVWFGLGMMGLVGWSVAVPTVAAVAVGRWIDTNWPSRVSWTLTGVFIGVVLGCLNAWYWVRRQNTPDE